MITVPLFPAIDTTAADIATPGQQAAGILQRAAAADHVHPIQEPLAEDYGYLAWAFDPTQIQAGQALATGAIWVSRVAVRHAVTVTNIILDVTSAGSGLTASQNFAGIYDAGGTQKGVTADQSASWNSNATKSMAIAGGAIALTAGFYYVAVVSNFSTTSPSFARTGSSPHTASVNGTNSAATSRSATNGTGTSLPGSLTMASNSAQNVQLWAAFT